MSHPPSSQNGSPPEDARTDPDGPPDAPEADVAAESGAMPRPMWDEASITAAERPQWRRADDADDDIPAPPPAHAAVQAAPWPQWDRGATAVLGPASTAVMPRPGRPATLPAELDPHLRRAATTPSQLVDSNRSGTAMPTFGPPGKRRSPAGVVVLSVLTLGIYPLVWHTRINREMGDFDPRMQVRASSSTWALAIPLVLVALVTLAAAARIVAGHFNVGPHPLPLTPRETLPLLGAPVLASIVVLLLPFSAVAVVMTLERIRVVQDRVGVSPDQQLRPVASLGWLVVPLLGGFVLMVRQQRRLNEVWEMLGR